MHFSWRSLALLALAAASLGGCGDRATRNEAGQSSNTATANDPSAMLTRGRYLAGIMDCAGCHNTGAFGPHPEQGYLEGGTVGFELPGAGVFTPPNLTPHPDAGIGRWSVEDIM